MPKAKEGETGIASRTVIKFHSHHEDTPDLYEIRVSDRLVAYVIPQAPFPITAMPKGSAKQPTLTTEEWAIVAEKAREEMKRIVAKHNVDGSELERILAGI